MNRPSKRRRMAGRGALLIVACMFVISGGLRLGSGTGLAVAREVEALRNPEVPMQNPETCAPTPDAARLLEALLVRDEESKRLEQSLSEKERTLALVEEEVALRLAALETAERRLRDTIALADEAAENDLARLTTVYENMKPKDAAAVFEQMTPEFAAGFLGRMRPDAAAAVMSGMSPEAAYSATVLIAGRNANVPTD